jgi:hypothetical protein
MYTGVEEIVPDEPMVTVLLNVELSVLTSNPVGGVTKMPASILAPDTLKLVDADAVPEVVLNAEGVPVVDTRGVVTALDGMLTSTVVAPVLVKTILPE